MPGWLLLTLRLTAANQWEYTSSINASYSAEFIFGELSATCMRSSRCSTLSRFRSFVLIMAMVENPHSHGTDETTIARPKAVGTAGRRQRILCLVTGTLPDHARISSGLPACPRASLTVSSSIRFCSECVYACTCMQEVA